MRVAGALLLAFAALTSATAPALANGPDAATLERWQVVLGAITPPPDAYLNSGILKPTETLETLASIPGLPVRQHPLNAGLFATGCAQCHRLAGPLPVGSGAPADIFDRLPVPAPPQVPPPAGFERRTDSAYRDEAPGWSPDGSSLMFERRDQNGGWTLMLVATSGGAPRALTSGRDAGWAEWSPDGRRIVYWAADEGEGSNLWLIDASGAPPLQLTDVAATAFPVWSPDGRRIAYQEKRATGTWALALIDPDGGEPRILTPREQTMPSRPQFSPDGRSIAYQVDVHGTFGLWRLVFPPTQAGVVDYAAAPSSVPGSTLLPMDIGQARGNSAWNADGTRVALLMTNLVTAPTGDPLLSYKTWLVAPDGSHPQVLLPGRTLADRSPSWSPTGRWLVQWSWNEDLRAAVWLISADGSTAVDLTANFGADALYPSWSPDGTRVAFSSNRGGSFDIWIADLSTLVPDFRP
jgi:Tol biopolymer transport system component